MILVAGLGFHLVIAALPCGNRVVVGHLQGGGDGVDSATQPGDFLSPGNSPDRSPCGRFGGGGRGQPHRASGGGSPTLAGRHR